jgi:hypothetical protein
MILELATIYGVIHTRKLVGGINSSYWRRRQFWRRRRLWRFSAVFVILARVFIGSPGVILGAQGIY